MSSPSSRPRILLITRNLPPLVGGMERLNWHMAEELSKVADVRVVGPEGAAAMAPADVPVREAPLKPLWKFLLRARAMARREARAWKPDVVLAGSGLTAPLARAAARTCGAKSAVYVHGLDVAVQHPVYRAVWIPALRRMDRVIANSRATAALCRDIGIDPARIGIVHPGVDLPVGGPEGPTSVATASQTAVAASAALTLGSVGSSVGGPEGPTSVATASQTAVAASAAPTLGSVGSSVGGPEGPTSVATASQTAVAASAAPTLGSVGSSVGGPEGPTSVAMASQTAVAASAAPTGGVAAVAGGSEGPTSVATASQTAVAASAAPTLASVGSSVGGPEGPTSVATASQTAVAASAAPTLGSVGSSVGGPEGPTSVATTSQTAVAASAAPTGGVAAVAGGSEGLADFRHRHHLDARPLLLSVGRLSARKGLREFVTLALPQIVAVHPDAMLLVVGDAPHDALHAEAQTPDSIRTAALQAGVAENLRFLGKITDDELAAAFCAADVHVFPVREIPGDPEGFGMVAVEAAAQGLATVAFATGGVVDAVSEGQSGFLVTASDYAAFVAAVLRALPVSSSMTKCCLAFARQFAWPKFGGQVIAQLACIVPELPAHGESA